MSGIQMALLGSVASNTGVDTQTVTTGATGSASPNFDRQRGYIRGSIGSISPGTSSIYGGALINYIVWEERGGFPDSTYILSISGATNSGWTTLTIGAGASQEILSRTSAIFSSGGIWEWSTTDGAGGQAFGAAGTVVSCVFA